MRSVSTFGFGSVAVSVVATGTSVDVDSPKLVTVGGVFVDALSLPEPLWQS